MALPNRNPAKTLIHSPFRLAVQTNDWKLAGQHLSKDAKISDDDANQALKKLALQLIDNPTLSLLIDHLLTYHLHQLNLEIVMGSIRNRVSRIDELQTRLDYLRYLEKHPSSAMNDKALLMQKRDFVDEFILLEIKKAKSLPEITELKEKLAAFRAHIPFYSLKYRRGKLVPNTDSDRYLDIVKAITKDEKEKQLRLQAEEKAIKEKFIAVKATRDSTVKETTVQHYAAGNWALSFAPEKLGGINANYDAKRSAQTSAYQLLLDDDHATPQP